MIMNSKNTEDTNFQKYLDLIRGLLSNEITAPVFETRFLQLRRYDAITFFVFSFLLSLALAGLDLLSSKILVPLQNNRT